MRLLILILLLIGTLGAAQSSDDPSNVSQYNVIWNSPSKNSWGSMPTGNGDLGLNVWVEENGDVLFYIGKTDAWSESVRLLKLGRVRLRFSPSPFSPGDPFRQTLNLKTGEIQIQAGKPDNEVRVSIWADANNPVIRVDAETRRNTTMQAVYERWRDQQRRLEGDEVQSAHGMQGGPDPLISFGDTIQLDAEEGVVWYHRNPKSAWATSLKLQGFTVAATTPDPILNRTFGAAMIGPDLAKINSTTLQSAEPAQKHALNVYAHTAVTGSSEDWLRELRATVTKVSGTKIEARRAAHEKWWSDFWDRSYIHITGDDAARKVSQAYALQRFVNAAGGRGVHPIKANGSIFTMDGKVNDITFDPDFRRGGGAYSFRRNRLVYWPMLASGDTDLMTPFVRMFSDGIYMAQQRSKLYFNHDGLCYPETMYFFGAIPNADYGWNRQGKAVSAIENPELRTYFVNNLELLAMLLEYTSYRDDKTFFRNTLPFLADDVISFYDNHYQREAEKLRIAPAQVLDSWKEAVNPLPDVAGLRFILTELIDHKVPLGKQSQTSIRRLLNQVPDLPITDGSAGKMLAPAERVFGERTGGENPELYAIFPFKLYGLELPEFEVAERTFQNRKNSSGGLGSTDALYAAYLGLAGPAKDLISAHLGRTDPEMRFPAFWTAGDGTPDQAHGGAGMLALQSMLIQANGSRLLVAPAWPKSWDVDFKLYAPGNTAVEGSIRSGKIEKLVTTPQNRLNDIKRFDPQ